VQHFFAGSGLGNLVLRAFGLKPGAGEEMLHSTEELKMLVSASREAGLLQQAQQEVVERVFNIGERHVGEIMTPRTDIVWLDAQGERDEMLRTLRECRHTHLLVARGDVDELLGMVTKQDLLDQLLDGHELDPLAALSAPLTIQESTPIFKVLERFRAAPVRMAIVLNEYGGLEGIVTPTDLLEAVVGHLPETEGDTPNIVEREDGSLLIDGTCPIFQLFERLGWRQPSERGTYHTAAGFVLVQLAHIPQVGESFVHQGWRLEVVDTDGRRIDKLLATRDAVP
jgi:CBS domain containing-hemolysin-like protein